MGKGKKKIFITGGQILKFYHNYVILLGNFFSIKLIFSFTF